MIRKRNLILILLAGIILLLTGFGSSYFWLTRIYLPREIDANENAVIARLTFKSKTGHQFEVIASNREQVWNDGHLCIKCIKDLIAKAGLKKIN